MKKIGWLNLAKTREEASSSRNLDSSGKLSESIPRALFELGHLSLDESHTLMMKVLANHFESEILSIEEGLLNLVMEYCSGVPVAIIEITRELYENVRWPIFDPLWFC
uniref:Uncharacterized protein n=1 Tax=Palpitomonas bilix TaxID=652834 RepID=A0A7S3GMH7_9EUKA|mmetsp:Transcript_9730/g.26086  ORF Transcript_9730/g.26086 Transcript_9730/m.26086 type:complete len:108 (+) Transcript_9730:107-430(+)